MQVAGFQGFRLSLARAPAPARCEAAGPRRQDRLALHLPYLRIRCSHTWQPSAMYLPLSSLQHNHLITMHCVHAFSGVDVHQDDALGKMALTTGGVLARDRFVLQQCAARNVPLAAAIGGGYEQDHDRIVDRCGPAVVSQPNFRYSQPTALDIQPISYLPMSGRGLVVPIYNKAHQTEETSCNN